MVAFISVIVVTGFLMASLAVAPTMTVLGIIFVVAAFYILPGWLVWTIVGIIIAATIAKGVLL